MPEGYLTFLEAKSLQLMLFGGKGGSGKTTSAAATAVHLAGYSPDRKILVVSTDPAHSLGDSFDYPIGDKITPVPGVENLWALEIDATRLLEEFKEEHGEVIKKLADRGTYFDRDDIADFLNLSLPGLDELMAIIKVADILKSDRYDLIILDTAPTGHTIGLLALPEQMVKWIHLMDLMQEKHRYLAKQFAGRYIKDDADQFLETMTRDVERVKSLLKDSRATEFIPVTIPEPMSISETERLVATLQDYKIPVRSIIVNRLMGEQKCIFCSARREDQGRYIREIDEKFAGCNLIRMPLFPHEIRGVEALREFGDFPFGTNRLLQRVTPISTDQRRKIRENQHPKISLDQRLQFIFFGGKGGVGKTSTAAATALKMAQQYLNKRVLAFSTDPAHALSDSFACPVGDRVTPVGGVDNLYALELNAARLLDDLKREYRADIDEVFDKFLGGHIDVKFDWEVMAELIDLSPPGLDEIMALKKIMDFVEDEAYDLYVIDAAATGHLLRFLELPDLVRDWLKTLFKILIKYKGVVKLTKTAQTMVDLSKSVRKIQETLTDPEKSEFVTVAMPEAMGTLEMEDLLSSLKRLKIPCRRIVMNMVIPPTQCGFCASKGDEQQRYIQQTQARFPDYTVTEIPLFPHEIKGTENLKELSEVIYGEND